MLEEKVLGSFVYVFLILAMEVSYHFVSTVTKSKDFCLR